MLVVLTRGRAWSQLKIKFAPARQDLMLSYVICTSVSFLPFKARKKQQHFNALVFTVV